MLAHPSFRFVAIASLFLVSVYVRFHAELVSDAAWYLYVADGLLHGKSLYVDFMEVNPPLGMWLTVPIQWIANELHLAPIPVLISIYFMLTAICLALCNRYLKRHEAFTGNFRTWFIIGLAAILLFMPTRDFAEREHLLLLWFLPWVFLRALKNSDTGVSIGERVLIGVMAGIAISIKPQAIFAPFCVELFLWWRNRHLTQVIAVENIAAITVAAIYGLAIVFFTPAFLHEMVHLGVKAYIPYNGESTFAVIYMGMWATVLLGFGFLIRQSVVSHKGDDLFVGILLAAAAGFLLSYFIQAKGFFYQSMPTNVFGMAACMAGTIWLLQSGVNRLLPILAAMIAAAFLATEKQSYFDFDYAFWPTIQSEAPNAKSIFIASTRIDLAFPLVVKHDLEWASRSPTQWLVPYLVANSKQGEIVQDAIAAKSLDWTVSDIANMKPDIIFVDSAKNQIDEPGGPFDYLKFWARDPRFESIWQNYQLKTKKYGFDVYVLSKP